MICLFSSLSDNSIFLDFIVFNDEFKKIHKSGFGKKLKINLVKICDKFKPDFIVNFSAQGMVAESWKSPLDWYNTNLMAQVRFHEEIRNKKYIKREAAIDVLLSPLTSFILVLR